MSLKDKFNNFIDYFTEDGEEVEVREAKAAGAETQPVPQPQPTPQVTSSRPQISQREPVNQNRLLSHLLRLQCLQRQ